MLFAEGLSRRRDDAVTASQTEVRGVVMKRIVAFWPYVLIVISLVGLAYTFLAASQLR